ncbi:MAG: hypothetical protein JWO89_1848 [Verrucomicrobiaceae bacterium]|nr:hypothetical protein [Verrucomicrobiaceae bacterium]
MAKAMAVDPRYYQITVLGSLLIYGVLALDFEVTWSYASIILASVLGTQWLCSWMTKTGFEWRSAMISGLSLCLLCRTQSWQLAALAGVLAIATKFLFRRGGKHWFNPTNIALVLLMLVTEGRVWVSPGQWGNVAFFAFLMACLGGLVVMRAARADVALAFLTSWIILITGRSVWLHEPMTIPLHRLQNGALLLFTFFMISDPRTTPDSRAGRIVFAMLVAWCGWWWQFRMFGTNGLLWSLAACSLLTPLIDWLLPGPRYDWRQRIQPHPDYEKIPAPSAGGAEPALPC